MFEKSFGTKRKKEMLNIAGGAALAGAIVGGGADGLPAMPQAGAADASTENVHVVNVDDALKQPAGPGGAQVVVNEGKATIQFPVAPELTSADSGKPAGDLAESPFVKKNGSE
jgi:hypothetical protein